MDLSVLPFPLIYLLILFFLYVLTLKNTHNILLCRDEAQGAFLTRATLQHSNPI